MKHLQERLQEASVVNESTGCREWLKATNTSGYGILWFNGKPGSAHRAAWLAEHGEIPDGMHVLHKCDNRQCINVDHLFLGTNADNVADKVRKGRQSRYRHPIGEQHHAAKLTDNCVRQIRALAKQGGSNRAIAGQFGVSIMTVSFIRNHKTWTHIQEDSK